MMPLLMCGKTMDLAALSKDFVVGALSFGVSAKVYGICMVIIVLMRLLILKRAAAWFRFALKR